MSQPAKHRLCEVQTLYLLAVCVYIVTVLLYPPHFLLVTSNLSFTRKRFAVCQGTRKILNSAGIGSAEMSQLLTNKVIALFYRMLKNLTGLRIVSLLVCFLFCTRRTLVRWLCVCVIFAHTRMSNALIKAKKISAIF